MEDFDGGIGVQAHMFAQIDFCEAALAEETDETVVAEPLANTIFHWCLSLLIGRLENVIIIAVILHVL